MISKKQTRNKRTNKQKRYKKRVSRTRKMRGGAFSQNELQQLRSNGFSDEQIQTLDAMNVPFNDLMMRINQLWNQGDNGFHGNSDDFSEQIMIDILNEHIFDSIPQAEDDVHDMDISFNGDNDSLHLSDLNVSQDSMRTNTTIPDESLNNSQFSNDSMSSLFSENESSASEMNGGKRKRKTMRHRNKKERSKKQTGGTCFGNGVGSNNNDPNYSIYNTNMLKLFPYKT